MGQNVTTINVVSQVFQGCPLFRVQFVHVLLSMYGGDSTLQDLLLNEKRFHLTICLTSFCHCYYWLAVGNKPTTKSATAQHSKLTGTQLRDILPKSSNLLSQNHLDSSHIICELELSEGNYQLNCWPCADMRIKFPQWHIHQAIYCLELQWPVSFLQYKHV